MPFMPGSRPDSHIDDLREALGRISVVSNASWEVIAPWCRARQLEQGEFLLRAGERASQIYFVRSGLLREFALDHEGRSATRRFCDQGDLSGSLADLLSGAPAMTFIEALEPSSLWQIPWAQVDAMTHAWPDWQLLVRRVAENLYLRKTRREFEMLTLSAAQRYERFCAEHASLLARLPQHLIASYLGITPVHLSRLRGSGRSAPATAAKPGRT